MRRIWGPALVLAALFLILPGIANAQMEFALDEVDEPAETATEAKPGEERTDLFEELATEETSTNGPTEMEPVREESAEEIYAVQQLYALRLKRFELAPSGAFTLNDPYLSHPGVGVAFNYWFTNVLAIGANWVWYDFGNPLDRQADLIQQVQKSFRLGVPINEWQQGAWVNFTYVPFYGKFSAFRKFIFQWDAYLLGGVGFMRTQPIPVFDTDNRSFDYDFRMSFNVGLGLRVFLTRFLSIFGEFRDYMWLEQYEATTVSPGAPEDPDTWLADDTKFFNNASIQFGISIFFPFKVEYRLPK